MANNKNVALRKRQQIDSSRRTMFIFVAGAAFIAGMALVVSFFLVQQIIFRGKVLIEKQTTISRLDTDLTNITKLKDNLRVLETNTALGSVKLKEGGNSLQTVLDALPDVANPDALGASIQEKFVGGISGLNIDGLVVGADAGDVSSSSSDGSNGNQGQSSGNSMPFVLTVRGSAENMRELLTKFEKSIRAIQVTSIDVQASDKDLIMKVQGQAPYQMAQEVKLETKVVKP